MRNVGLLGMVACAILVQGCKGGESRGGQGQSVRVGDDGQVTADAQLPTADGGDIDGAIAMPNFDSGFGREFEVTLVVTGAETELRKLAFVDRGNPLDIRANSVGKAAVSSRLRFASEAEWRASRSTVPKLRVLRAGIIKNEIPFDAPNRCEPTPTRAALGSLLGVLFEYEMDGDSLTLDCARCIYEKSIQQICR